MEIDPKANVNDPEEQGLYYDNYDDNIEESQYENAQGKYKDLH